MDQRTSENPQLGPEIVQKGTPFHFPPPTQGRTEIPLNRRLIEKGKPVGILKGNADHELPQDVANKPLDSWIVSMEANIDYTAGLSRGESIAIAGNTFRTLMATKPDGTMQICFGAPTTKPDTEPEQSVRSIVYRKWVDLNGFDPDYISEARRLAASRSADNPLTLTTEEIPTTVFEFI